MSPKDKKLLAIQVILLMGMLISLFLVYEHFSPSASKFCTFGNSFDCGIVNKSPYANIDGISYLLTIDFSLPIPLINISGINLFFDLMTSNAFLGFLTLLFLFFLIKSYREGKGMLWMERNSILSWCRGILIFSVIYGFYLFLIQHLILKTYCIFCLVLDIILLTSLFLLLIIKR